jgi:hypothetical protein
VLVQIWHGVLVVAVDRGQFWVPSPAHVPC